MLNASGGDEPKLVIPPIAMARVPRMMWRREIEPVTRDISVPELDICIVVGPQESNRDRNAAMLIRRPTAIERYFVDANRVEPCVVRSAMVARIEIPIRSRKRVRTGRHL